MVISMTCSRLDKIITHKPSWCMPLILHGNDPGEKSNIRDGVAGLSKAELLLEEVFVMPLWMSK